MYVCISIWQVVYVCVLGFTWLHVRNTEGNICKASMQLCRSRQGCVCVCVCVCVLLFVGAVRAGIVQSARTEISFFFFKRTFFKDDLR